MNLEAKPKQILSTAVAILVSCSFLLTPAKSQEKRHAKVVELDSHGKDYLQVLAGPRRASP